MYVYLCLYLYLCIYLYEFSTAYSTNNWADSLHRKLLSYRQNRNDAKNLFKHVKCPCVYYSNSSATFHCILEGDFVFKLNPGPTNNDDQSTISTYCSRGCCTALSTWSAVLPIAPNVSARRYQDF